MRFKKGLFLLLLFLPTLSFGASSLRKVEVLNGNLIYFNFDQPIRQDQVSVEFVQDEVRLSVEGATVHPAKIIPVKNGGPISQVFAYQFNPNVVHCRIGLKAKAEDYRQYLDLKPQGNRLQLKFFELGHSSEHAGERLAQRDGDCPNSAADKRAVRENQVKNDQVVVTQGADERVLEQKVLNSDSNPTVHSIASTARPTEDVNQPALKPLPSLTSVLLKLALVSGLVVLLAALMKYLKSIPVSSQNRLMKSLQGFAHGSLKQGGPSIEVLGSHFIGPKKSLVTVRVAQQTLLLGVTEQSIQLISELPVETAQSSGSDTQDLSFEETLNAQSETGIRSRIRSRLEGLKPL